MSAKSFWISGKGCAALILIGAASYFLLIEHRQHLFEWLPFLIIALCPLMHLFMHGSHGHHSDQDHDGGSMQDREEAAYRQDLEDAGKQSRQDLH